MNKTGINLYFLNKKLVKSLLFDYNKNIKVKIYGVYMIVNNLKLTDLLKKNGITKSVLCDKLGISSRTIAKISKGENISNIVVGKIADFLSVDIKCIAFNNILITLQNEKTQKISGGLYHETQIKLTYNSNHIEGSRLTEDQTRYIFQTKTLGDLPANIYIDDILETNNHFLCVDYIIDFANSQLTQEFIFSLHNIHKNMVLENINQCQIQLVAYKQPCHKMLLSKCKNFYLGITG